jgi:hypothetical protein
MRETDPLSIHSTGLGDDEPASARRRPGLPRAPPSLPSPAYCSIADWVQISGVSRSVTYELLSAGKIEAVKLGVKTLIDVRSGLAYLRSLPRAEISTGRNRRPRPAETAE